MENVISEGQGSMADGTVWDRYFIYGIFYNSTIKSITNGRDDLSTFKQYLYYSDWITELQECR